MNKKFLLGMFAAAGMLFATSCSNDELIEQGSGDTATVSFTVNTEGAVASRATISDGTEANELYFVVKRVEHGDNEYLYHYVDPTVYGEYKDGNNNYGKITDFNKSTTLTLKLAKGQDYVVGFFAKNENAPYEVNENGTVSMNYVDVYNNNETYDAFFASEAVPAANRLQSYEVTLKRPFAQVNVGTSDYQIAGVQVCGSQVTFNGVADQLNLLSGDVSLSDSFDGKVTFKMQGGENALYSASPSSPQKELTVNDKNYTWLSMCYVLPQDKEQSTTVSTEFEFEVANGNNITLTDGLQNIPIQRNYRTNIYGNLLTSNEKFNVEIKPGFDGEYNESAWDGTASKNLTTDENGYYRIKSAADFAYFMTTCQNGNSVYTGKTIVLDTDINLADKTISGIGNQYCNFSGTFDGNGHTISNFVINSTNEWYAGLFQQVSHNATIKNLTVVGATVTGNKMVGIIASSLNENSTIENCYVENCVVIAKVKKSGAITGYIAENSTVKGCSVKNTAIYCADADESQSDKIIGYVDGSNTVENNTASDDVTVTRNVISVSTAEELSNVGSYNGTVNNVVTSKNIILTNDIDCSGVQLNPIRLDGTCTFDGCGHTLKNVTVGEIGGRRALFNGEVIPGANVIIKNLNIDKVTVSKANAGVGDQYAAVLYGDMQNGLTLNIENVHINNAIVKNHNTVGGFVGFISGAGSNSLSIKNSSIKNSTISGKDEVGKVGALVGRAYGNGYTCSGVEVHSVELYLNNQLLETVAHGAKGPNGCDGGYTID